MKQVTVNILAVLGVLFIMLIIVVSAFIIADPYELRPLIFGSPSTGATYSSRPANTSGEAGTQTANGEFYLSDQQKQALINFGIDPSVVPSQISAEQESCFINILGEGRVGEIKNGAVPSAVEFYKAKACI